MWQRIWTVLVAGWLTWAAVGSAQTCVPQPAGLAQEFQVFVTGNLNLTSDVPGRVAAGGDAGLSDVEIAAEEPATAPGFDTLVVGGALSYQGGIVHTGDVVWGVSADLVDVSIAQGVSRQGTPVSFEAERTRLLELSDFWAALPAEGQVEILEPSPFVREIALTGTDPEVNVFRLPVSELQTATRVTVSVPETASVLVDVTGDAGDVQRFAPPIEWQGVAPERLAINFSTSSGILLAPLGLVGLVVAPRAHVDVSDGQFPHTFSGSLIAQSASVASAAGLQRVPFTGCLPAPQPTDLEAPSLEISSPEPEVFDDPTPEILLTYSDDGSGVVLESLVVTMDGVALTTCSVAENSASCEPEELVEGEHTILASIEDRAGNRTEATRTFSLDLIDDPPQVTLTSPAPNAIFNTSTVQVSGSVTDDRAVASVHVHGIQATIVNGSFSADVGLEEGLRSILVLAADSGGHVTEASVEVTVDISGPTLEVSQPIDGQVVNSSTATVAGRIQDETALATFEIAGNPLPAQPGSFEQSVPLAAGTNLLLVRATDTAGNTSEVGVQVIRLDVPRVRITSPLDGAFVDGATVHVTGQVSDPTAQVEVSGQSVSVSQDGSFEAVGVSVAEGSNTLEARATIPSGTMAATSVSVFRDLTPPRLIVDRPQDEETIASSSVTVTGLVQDLGVAAPGPLRVLVNGSEAEVVNGRFLAADVALPMGPSSIAVVAEDAAGNVAEQRVDVVSEPSSSGLQRVSGNLQQATVGTELLEPLVVELRDGAGLPPPNVPVVFEAAGNNGELRADGAADPGRRKLTLATDSNGRAAVRFVLGSRAGSQQVRVSSPGAGEVVFDVRATVSEPAQIFVDSGGNQDGAAGGPASEPMAVVVTDESFNRVAGVPVVFTVVEGSGSFADGLQQTEIVTDELGRAAARLAELDPEEGEANNVVEATFGDRADGFATFVASSRAAGDPTQTAVTGLVLDNADRPVPGVTVHLSGTELTATTAPGGTFRIEPAPVGTLHLEADGSTTSRPGTWPVLEFELTTIPGRDNDMGRPIYLLPLDVERGIQVTETEGGVLELPEMPGFSLDVAPGSVTFPGGGRSGTVSVTLVHGDKVPMVPNFSQQPRFVISIQPAGALFDPPARITLPNTDGLEPGEVTELYSFDHDLGRFVSIGPGTVSDDGRSVVSNPGVGIVKAGWHCGGNPVSTGTPHRCPQCQICDGSRCVPGCSVSGVTSLTGRDLGVTECGCDDEDACTVDDHCADGGCIGDPIEIEGLAATANGEVRLDVATEETLLFEAEVAEENCDEPLAYTWEITRLGDLLPSVVKSGQEITHEFLRPGIYDVEVTAKCKDCVEVSKSILVVVYEIQMKLELMEITISEDGRYSEDAMIRVTAVRSDTGEVLRDFTGEVAIEEVTEGEQVYSQNGGELPSSVPISFSGTNFFIAKSLAGPMNNRKPLEALIETTDYPLFGGESLAVEQWVDHEQVHHLAAGGVFDWLETIIKDLENGTNGIGDLAAVFATISGYSVDPSISSPGQVARQSSQTSEILLNPFLLKELRFDGSLAQSCTGQSPSPALTTSFIHEARHTWQNFLTTVDLDSPDDRPSAPNNDDDRDFLVDNPLICPCEILRDSPTPRDVCIQSNGSIITQSYSGDAQADDSSLQNLAAEMDASIFALQHASSGGE